MCCGNLQDLSDPRRFGALAVLEANYDSENNLSSENISGLVMFFNDTDRESNMATHLKFTPNESSSPLPGLALTIL